MNAKTNQPTFKRQRFLLAFIRQIHHSVTSTDLQKLVFLSTMSENSELYEFIPYNYGPYSFQLAEDLDILRRDGYLSVDYSPECTQIKAVGEYIHKNYFQIVPERGMSLIRKAYRAYPYYAVNSEISGQLFHGAELERLKNEKKALTRTEQVLFTIGYEGKSIEAFINTLIQNDIRLLCDVRKNPLSRKFGFSKGKLEHIAETAGIKYIHIPTLGIDSDKRSSLDTVADYQVLFNDYAKTLPALEHLLEQIFSLLRSHVRIALMCYEKEPALCHRHVIRDTIAKSHEIRSIDLS